MVVLSALLFRPQLLWILSGQHCCSCPCPICFGFCLVGTAVHTLLVLIFVLSALLFRLFRSHFYISVYIIFLYLSCKHCCSDPICYWYLSYQHCCLHSICFEYLSCKLKSSKFHLFLVVLPTKLFESYLLFSLIDFVIHLHKYLWPLLTSLFFMILFFDEIFVDSATIFKLSLCCSCFESLNFKWSHCSWAVCLFWITLYLLTVHGD